MKISLKLLMLCLVVLLWDGCASIVSKSKYPIQLNSDPKGAEVTVVNSKGVQVFKGVTPTTATLKSGEGYFKKATYNVTFSKDGYDSQTLPLTASLDGWYFGNILFGGLIGLLIVDPATGAMYRLDSAYVNGSLSKSMGRVGQPELQIYEYAKIPEVWKEHLIEVKP